MSPKKSDVLKDAEEIKDVDGAVVEEAVKTEEPAKENIKEAEEAQKAKEIKDLTLYVASGFDFESAKKEKIVVPPLGGKQEKKAILTLLTFLSGDDGVMEQLFSSGGNVQVSDLLRILTSGGEKAWDCLVEITGYLIDQPTEWISEHLMLPDMIQVVRPFFLTEGKTLIQAFKN